MEIDSGLPPHAPTQRQRKSDAIVLWPGRAANSRVKHQSRDSATPQANVSLRHKQPIRSSSRAADPRLQKCVSTVMKALMNKELEGAGENKGFSVIKRTQPSTCMISVNKCGTLMPLVEFQTIMLQTKNWRRFRYNDLWPSTRTGLHTLTVKSWSGNRSSSLSGSSFNPSSRSEMTVS